MSSLSSFIAQYQFGDITRYFFYGGKKKKEDLTEEEKQQRDIYKNHRRQFRDAVDAVLSGASITQQQIDQLWDLSKHLKAHHAAKILAKCLQSISSASTRTDDPQAEDKFRMVFKMLLVGDMITAKQLELIATAASNLTRETVTRICSEELTKAYEQRQAAIEAAKAKEIEFCDKFGEVLRVAVDSSSLSDDMFCLLVNASHTLPPHLVEAMMKRLNTSWEALHAKHNANSLPSNISSSAVSSAVPAPLPKPSYPPSAPVTSPSEPESSTTNTGKDSHAPTRRLSEGLLSDITRRPALRSSSNSTEAETSSSNTSRRSSLSGLVLADIAGGKNKLKKVSSPSESNAKTNGVNKSKSALVQQLSDMLAERRIYTVPDSYEGGDESDNEEW